MLVLNMQEFEQFTILPGSIRRLRIGNRINAVDRIENIEITVQVRRKKELDPKALATANKILSLRELEEEYGASLCVYDE